MFFEINTTPKPLVKPELLRGITSPNAVKRNKARIIRQLRRTADAIERDLTEKPASAVFVAIMGPEGPDYTYAGFETWDDFKSVQHVVKDAVWGQFWDACGHKSNRESEDESTIAVGRRAVQRGWEQRQQYPIINEQRRAKHASENPWQCEYCDRRFQTERGAKQHEAYNRKLACICGTPRCEAVASSSCQWEEGRIVLCGKCKL